MVVYTDNQVYVGFGVPRNVLVFLALNLLALVVAVVAFRRQNKYLEGIPNYFREVTTTEWEYDTPRPSLATPYALALGAIVAIGSTLYVVFHQFLPFQPPYLLRVLPRYGEVLQVGVAIVFWTPTTVITVIGLNDAYRYFRYFEDELDAVSTDVDVDDLPAVRGLLKDSPSRFFETIQIVLLLWGLLGGIAISVVFFAREEVTIIVGTSTFVVLVLSYIFLRPLLAFTVWLATRSGTVQSALLDRLTETRLRTVAATTSTDPEQMTREDSAHGDVSSVELESVIRALPPSNPWQLLWEQSLQTLVALLGPFISVLVKLLQLI